MSRVIQISIDILVEDTCDGFDLADEADAALKRQGYVVLGAGFQEDMTECYKENYPELLKGE